MNHEDEFDNILNDYNFILGIKEWTTADLVKIANLIDVELQQRGEQTAASVGVYTPELSF